MWLEGRTVDLNQEERQVFGKSERLSLGNCWVAGAYRVRKNKKGSWPAHQKVDLASFSVGQNASECHLGKIPLEFLFQRKKQLSW